MYIEEQKLVNNTVVKAHYNASSDGATVQEQIYNRAEKFFKNNEITYRKIFLNTSPHIDINSQDISSITSSSTGGIESNPFAGNTINDLLTKNKNLSISNHNSIQTPLTYTPHGYYNKNTLPGANTQSGVDPILGLKNISEYHIESLSLITLLKTRHYQLSRLQTHLNEILFDYQRTKYFPKFCEFFIPNYNPYNHIKSSFTINELQQDTNIKNILSPSSLSRQKLIIQLLFVLTGIDNPQITRLLRHDQLLSGRFDSLSDYILKHPNIENLRIFSNTFNLATRKYCLVPSPKSHNVALLVNSLLQLSHASGGSNRQAGYDDDDDEDNEERKGSGEDDDDDKIDIERLKQKKYTER